MIQLELQSENISDYLKETKYMDFNNKLIREKANELFSDCNNDIEKVKLAFEFVRDKIPHSWDIESEKISIYASEVLKIGNGMCYEKSSLLATLLRGQGIPAGICYQKLTLGETNENGYIIHALNSVYITDKDKWIRLDARGNKPGINAQFSLETEQLAFPIRPQYYEIDYPKVYTEHLQIIKNTLENNTNCLEMIQFNCPSEL